jgi:FlaA1/EpsC-like NDP-sugar epimerase
MISVIKSLTQNQKRTIILLIDCLLIPVALVFSFAVQPYEGGLWSNLQSYLPIFPYVLAAAVALSFRLGICTIQLNSYESGAVWQTAVYSGFLVAISAILSKISNLGLPFGFHVVFGAGFFFASVISRAVLLQIVLAAYRSSGPHCRVLIYGAGTTGTQLVSALRSHKSIEPIAFVDDKSAMHGLTVSRLPVYNPLRLAEIVEEKKIDRVLLAMPSLSPPKKAQIVRRLEKMGIEVQTLPSFAQLIGEETLLDKLKPISAKNLLGRDEVSDTLDHGVSPYKKRVVMVTGAGGTIGSELCHQVLAHRPAKIILFDLSEFALYNIDMELRQVAEGTGVEIVTILGSVTDPRQVRKVMADHAVQVVLHAAAYKHVPIVENNPLAGIVNNVFGTQTLAQEAAKAGVERFILISSDKAVRPTNVMGATKRLAEFVVQEMARRVPAGEGPIFTMVRFGNVLGSSGSVIPLFQDQINRGGPVTVTHPDVFRYFMTVQEAVRLVLQTGRLAKGGEVFVLDMGRPVSILSLARQVVENSGYTIRDEANPDGDIDIVFTGLRPGEKMVEELTLTDDLIGTIHPKIMCAHEDRLSEQEVSEALRRLREAFIANNEDLARQEIMRWVEPFENQDTPPVSQPAQGAVMAGE